MKNAELIVIDEFSMVGRAMAGKIVYRTKEILGGAATSTMGGKDVLISGDSKQAPPIGDEPWYRYGAYKGKGVNKPRDGAAEGGAPSHEVFVHDGCNFRDEFEDVVLLREVHRIEFTAKCEQVI